MHDLRCGNGNHFRNEESLRAARMIRQNVIRRHIAVFIKPDAVDSQSVYVPEERLALLGLDRIDVELHLIKGWIGLQDRE